QMAKIAGDATMGGQIRAGFLSLNMTPAYLANGLGATALTDLANDLNKSGEVNGQVHGTPVVIDPTLEDFKREFLTASAQVSGALAPEILKQQKEEEQTKKEEAKQEQSKQQAEKQQQEAAERARQAEMERQMAMAAM